MTSKLWMGIGRNMLPVPGFLWTRRVRSGAKHASASLAFMSEEHHLVREFAVRELPRTGKPMPPEFIAGELSLPLERVGAVLDDLEKHMTFVCRDEHGAVEWAYPVTAYKTPHQVTFSTGERLYSAWAIDAFAVPFVQGQLLGAPLSVDVTTECAHCGEPLHLALDSEARTHVIDTGAAPITFIPDVDFSTLPDKCITDAFWRRSIFFWSEEHARQDRRQGKRGRGIYVSLEAAAYITRIEQGALFDFPNRARQAAG